MPKNMGNLDRIVRVIIALVIAYLWYTGVISGTLAVVLMVAAVIFVLTSVVSFCPLYKPLGINTCRR